MGGGGGGGNQVIIFQMWPNKCQKKGNDRFPYALATLLLAQPGTAALLAALSQA